MAQQGKNSPEGVKRATFTVDGREIVVHFNPESLTLNLSSSIASRGTNEAASGDGRRLPPKAQQRANTYAVTLSMKLHFDTTETGADVRTDTLQFQSMMNPDDGAQDPKIVLFSWGTFRFRGSLQSYSETLDYFSSTGVPLRSSVDLTMVENKDVQPGAGDSSGAAGGGIEIGARAGASLSASIGGDAFTARAVAELNGEASVRRLSGGSLEVNAEISLSGPVAFASGGASFSAGVSVGAGLGVGASAGVGVGGGLGLQLSGGAGAGIGGGITGGFELGARGAASFGLDAGAQLGLGFGASFGASATSSAAGGDARVRIGQLSGASLGGAAAASFGFGGGPASAAGFGAAASAPAQAFAADVASRADAAAAAGMAGASSGLLSPATGPFVPSNGVAFATAARARAVPGAIALAASDPQPTELQGPVWGSLASAGVPAVFGAFAGLQQRAAPPRIRRRIDLRRLLPAQPDVALHTDPNSAFEIGGRALSSQASGLNADVGANASLNDRIRFDEE